jgi:zinc/manganese transport system substrate-binding protein
LSQIDPTHQAEYQSNANRYIQQLEQLDKTLVKEFAAIPTEQRKMITSHDAFGYLSARYQITTIAPQGMSTESEASASDVAKIIQQIRKEKIKALFVENISDPRLMQQISKETDVAPGKELFSDALSDKSGPASTYLDMMRYNTAQILSALKQ